MVGVGWGLVWLGSCFLFENGGDGWFLILYIRKLF